MARFLVHGLVVETASSLGWDPGAELLAGFPVAGAGSAVNLRIEVRPGPVGKADPAADVVLLQTNVRVVLAVDALRVEAPGVLAHVPLDGDRIEVVVAPDGPGRHALVQVHLFLAFAAAARLRGWYHLHAGATVAPGGAPHLIAGPAGAGKSTLCAALVAAGHRYLGDDVLFVEGASGRLLAFPRAFHLGPEAAAALLLAPGALGERYGGGEKRILDAAAAFPGRAVLSAGVPGAILLPRVAAGQAESALAPASPVEATAELVESSAFVAARLPGHRAHVSALAAVADGAPAFWVALGRDLLERPSAVATDLVRQAGFGSP